MCLRWVCNQQCQKNRVKMKTNQRQAPLANNSQSDFLAEQPIIKWKGTHSENNLNLLQPGCSKQLLTFKPSLTLNMILCVLMENYHHSTHLQNHRLSLNGKLPPLNSCAESSSEFEWETNPTQLMCRSSTEFKWETTTTQLIWRIIVWVWMGS